MTLPVFDARQVPFIPTPEELAAEDAKTQDLVKTNGYEVLAYCRACRSCESVLDRVTRTCRQCWRILVLAGAFEPTIILGRR